MSGSLPCDTPRCDHAGLYPFVSGGHLGRFRASCNTKKKKCFCVFSFTSPCVGVHIFLRFIPRSGIAGTQFHEWSTWQVKSPNPFSKRLPVHTPSGSLQEVLLTHILTNRWGLKSCQQNVSLSAFDLHFADHYCFFVFFISSPVKGLLTHFANFPTGLIIHLLIDSGLFIYSWK